MSSKIRSGLLFVVACSLAQGCATRFSPATIRQEIIRQRGVDPQGRFELNLGRFTTYLLKSALTTDGGEVPFSGLNELQLSVYETAEQPGPALDVTLFAVRGWEPVIRARNDERSIMILVRSPTRLTRSVQGRSTIGDLVVVGSGRRKVVYGRLQGTLDPDLPARLGQIFERGGPDQMVEVLSSLDGKSAP